MDTSLTVCVKECPTYMEYSEKPTTFDCAPNSFVTDCEETSASDLLKINAKYDWSNWEEGIFSFDVSIEDMPTFIYNCTTCNHSSQT